MKKAETWKKLKLNLKTGNDNKKIEKAHILIHSLKTDGEFDKVEEKSMNIEFIGDSITSGEGSIGAKKEDDWISMWFTSHNNYAVMTAGKHPGVLSHKAAAKS